MLPTNVCMVVPRYIQITNHPFAFSFPTFASVMNKSACRIESRLSSLFLDAQDIIFIDSSRLPGIDVLNLQSLDETWRLRKRKEEMYLVTWVVYTGIDVATSLLARFGQNVFDQSHTLRRV